MAVLAMNNAWGLLSTAMTAQTNTLILQSGQASRFPIITNQGVDWFYVTIFDTNGNQEIVKVVVTQGDNFTVSRGVDGTTAMNWAASVRVQLNVTAQFWADYATDVAATAVTNRQFATPITLNADPTATLQASTLSYLQSKALPLSQPIQAPIGFQPVRQINAHKIYLGWNGSDCYVTVDSTLEGSIWRDSTINPANYAAYQAICQWNGGIVQIGAIDWELTGATVVDNASPYLMEGYTATETVDIRGNITSMAMYMRVVPMRNQ